MEKLNNMNTTATEIEGYPHKRGGAAKRKRGGKVPGKMAMSRPDKRARGGGVTSDENPLTTAGKMSSMPYENKEAKGGSEGEGADKT